MFIMQKTDVNSIYADLFCEKMDCFKRKRSSFQINLRHYYRKLDGAIYLQLPSKLCRINYHYMT